MMNFSHYITCIDAHTAGEPLRIITAGFPPIPGNTILEKRDYVNKNYDGLRRMLMLEPRGHSGMYGCILVPAVTPDGDFGVLFTHNEGLSSMCGHGIIGVTKVVIETGMIGCTEGENVIRIDSPAGRVTAYADVEKGKVLRVRFHNVPCFVYKENITVHVDSLNRDVVCDIAYCGAFYVYIDADRVDLEVEPQYAEQLVKIGMEIKHKVMEEYTFKHPTEPGIDWLYGTILMSPVERIGNRLISNNICIFAEGQIDRSPTGTGTGGRTALLVHKNIMQEDDTLVNKSVIDTPMESKVISRCKVGQYDAVITEVSGTAHITGFNNIVLDPDDPLPEGFRIIGS
ncbi:MAG TPA: proline racemase family protein [Bacillota bacterium]|nr:proline racemase family protein [Clostridiaceae bacterium]HNR04414.1 proline racemase family protein [Bacillota bacterium]HNT03425.1 proline racemase family protein [Bacillota bacterium]HPA53616.1 proline racemase family protein [Bacillota bacterium]HPX68831.1 proline racemase family protein [Bacillota bacterium]